MARHTPGPWRVDPRDSIQGAFFIRGPQNEYIARLTDETRTDLGDPEEAGTSYDPRPANARLIAAAPELVETVRTLLHIAEDEGWLGSDETNAAAALLARIEGD